MKNRFHRFGHRISGFSIIELIIVLGIIAVMSAISLPYIVNFKKGYKSEDQAIKMIDVMRETAQLALNRRRTMRFQIDLTANAMLIIDEFNAQPDVLVKSIPLELTRDLRNDIIPVGVTIPNPPNYANIAFTTDTTGHRVGAATVNGNSIWAARFRSDGSVVNAANVPISASIYIWPPVTPGSTTPRNLAEVRAITLFGGSGAIRYWKHNGTTFVANQ